MAQSARTENARRSRIYMITGGFVVALLLGTGVMARNGWFPNTDPVTGQRTGWFGAKLAKNAPSSWNPLAMPSPTPTPQLSKEYIYAGSRLLAVEDAGANATPPADLAVWRPGSQGKWYVLGGPGSAQTYHEWGGTGDIPVPGDYDGDGKTDFAIWRPSNGQWWIIRSSNGTNYAETYGQAGDIPVPADYDGDGKTDLALFRPNSPSSGLGTWFMWLSGTNSYDGGQFGLSTDIPFPKDYDGDGEADMSVFRSSDQTFYTYRSSDLTYEGALMPSSGTPVSADYDGDGRANYAVKDGNVWRIMNAAKTSTSAITFQNATDLPVQNDYDGDGLVDIASWRPSNGTWYIRQSSLLGQPGELRATQWGMTGDIPVHAYYRR